MKKLFLILIISLCNSIIYSQAGGVIEREEPIIYAITPDGNLNWYRHIGYTADLEDEMVLEVMELTVLKQI